jgi:hypothetical protein
MTLGANMSISGFWDGLIASSFFDNSCRFVEKCFISKATFFLEVSVLPKVSFSRASRERRFLYNVTDANRGDFPHCTINGFVDDGPSY